MLRYVFSTVSIMFVFVTGVVAEALRPGDILVVDRSAGTVTRVDPGTGAQSHSILEFARPESLVIDGDGDLFFSDSVELAIYRFEPDTGALSIVSSGGEFKYPYSLAIESSGNLLVGDSGKILRINTDSGVQTVLSSGADIGMVSDIVVDVSGNIIVCDQSNDRIVKVDPLSGARTTILDSGILTSPKALALDGDGDIIAISALSGLVLRIDPLTGSHTEITTLPTAPPGVRARPVDIVVGNNGRIFVIDQSRILEINANTGAQTIVRDGSSSLERDYTAIALDAEGMLVYADGDSDSVDPEPAIFRLDPDSYQRIPSRVTSSGAIGDPRAVLVGPKGKLIAAGWGHVDTSGRDVYRIDPANAVREAICCAESNGHGFFPSAISMEGTEHLLVGGTMYNGLDWIWKLIRYNLATGVETTVASGYARGLSDAVAVTVDENGRIFMLLNPYGIVVEIDADTGAQSTLAGHDAFGGVSDYTGMAVDRNGDLIVSKPDTGLHRLSTVTGEVLQTYPVSSPYGIAVDQAGNYIYNFVSGTWSSNPNAYIVSYDPVKGKGTVISSGGLFSSSLENVAIVPQLNVHADLVIDFGAIGLWARMNDTSWLKLNNSSPDQLAVADMDGNGQDDVVAVFGSGIFVKRNLGGWAQLHNFVPEAMAVGDLDHNGKDDLVIDFGAIGLWARMNDANWLKLNNSSPDQVVVADMDGNGQDDVVAVFGSGIFVKRNLGGWSQLHNFVPEALAVGDLDANGKDDLVIDFGSIGLWARMNDASWLKLHNSSPQLIATGDLDGNGADDVIATFSGSGLWQKVNLGGWGQLSASAPDEVIAADVDGNGQDDIIGNFGSTLGGLFVKRNQGSWTKLHNTSPDSMAAGNLDGK